MLSQLSTATRVVGVKQSQKAIREGSAKMVFMACDAEHRITRPIEALCQEKQVEVCMVETMQELGRAAGIDIGAAVVTVLQDDVSFR